jgi:hypothetical protein
MRRTRPVALLAAGSVTGSLLLRNPSVAAVIGPVKSTSLRVASRLVNALRAGHAVDTFEEFEDCRLILAVAPAQHLESLLGNLCAASGLRLATKCLVTAGLRPAGEATRTAIRSARVREVPGFDGRWFVADGNREAAVELRRVLGRSTRFTILPHGAEKAWDAAHTLMHRGFLATMSAADDCLRAAKLPQADADALIDRALARMGRAWTRGKRKGWPGAVPEIELDCETNALHAVEPALSRWYRAAVTESELYMEEPRRRAGRS